MFNCSFCMLISKLSHVVFLQSLFSPTCFSYAGQYISRYEVKGEGKLPHTHPLAQISTNFLLWLKPVWFFIIRNSLEQHVHLAHCWWHILIWLALLAHAHWLHHLFHHWSIHTHGLSRYDQRMFHVTSARPNNNVFVVWCAVKASWHYH